MRRVSSSRHHFKVLFFHSLSIISILYPALFSFICSPWGVFGAPSNCSAVLLFPSPPVHSCFLFSCFSFLIFFFPSLLFPPPFLYAELVIPYSFPSSHWVLHGVYPGLDIPLRKSSLREYQVTVKHPECGSNAMSPSPPCRQDPLPRKAQIRTDLDRHMAAVREEMMRQFME